MMNYVHIYIVNTMLTTLNIDSDINSNSRLYAP